MIRMPNRQLLPPSVSERFAEEYQGSPGRLVELARATGNHALARIAVDYLKHRNESRTAKKGPQQ
jgi:hypothetical protein